MFPLADFLTSSISEKLINFSLFVLDQINVFKNTHSKSAIFVKIHNKNFGPRYRGHVNVYTDIVDGMANINRHQLKTKRTNESISLWNPMRAKTISKHIARHGVFQNAH